MNTWGMVQHDNLTKSNQGGIVLPSATIDIPSTPSILQVHRAHVTEHMGDGTT